MPHSVAHPMIHIQIKTLMSQRHRPPINHQMEIFSQICSANNIHAGILHSIFSNRLISRHSRKLPLRFVRRIRPRDLPILADGCSPAGIDPTAATVRCLSAAIRSPGDCLLRRCGCAASCSRDWRRHMDPLQWSV